MFISEILASNSAVVNDPEYLNSGDYIEIFNNSNTDIDLGGYFLSDDYDSPSKWKIPDNTIIRAKDFILFWADGKNNNLHTNFKLSSSGEQVALVAPNKIILDSVSFGTQKTNVSIGRIINEAAQFQYFNAPTPDAPNVTASHIGVAPNHEISVDGGYFIQSQTISITSEPLVDVRFTLDGTIPTGTSELYSAPINIEQTTILRTVSYRENYLPGEVISNTYFIMKDGFEPDLPIIVINTNNQECNVF